MKRNNLFMLAYIIFIFICVAVRFFGEFPQWQVLVVAITATSWVFSLADFNHTVASELHAISKDILESEEACIENIQGMINAIDALLMGNSDESESAEKKQADYYVHAKQEAEKCLNACERLKMQAKKSDCTADIAEKMTSILTVVAFIGFFSILSFEEILRIFINNQDIMTAMAFGLILYTQYLGERSAEKRKKQKETADAINNGWNALRKSLEMEVASHAD